MTDDPLTTNEPFTSPQKEALRSVIYDMMREYWAEDAVREIARATAEETAARQNEYLISTRLAAIAETPDGLSKMVHEIFRNSGSVVKTKASEEFDSIVKGFIADEAAGIPEAIRQHVRDHLPELIQRAVSEILTALLVGAIKGDSELVAMSTKQMITDAFMRARMSPGY